MLGGIPRACQSGRLPASGYGGAGASRQGSRLGDIGSETGSYPGWVELEFSGEIWFWRGPAPWHFVTVPDEQCGALEATSPVVSYGWGMIPVSAQIGATEWQRRCSPRTAGTSCRSRPGCGRLRSSTVGDAVTVRLEVDL